MHTRRGRGFKGSLIGLAFIGLAFIAAVSVLGQQTPESAKPAAYDPYGPVKNARLVHAVPAAIPADVSLGNEKHVSTLSMVIGADGIPTDVLVLNRRKSPLDDAAVAAVKQSIFAPGTFRGKPVPVWAFVWVPFLGADHAAIPVTGQLAQIEDMMPPSPIKTVEADFSEEARRNHFSGAAVVCMTVTEDGLPADVHLVRPLGEGLGDQALKAARQYRFRPAELDGVPVPAPIMVEVSFRFRSDF